MNPAVRRPRLLLCLLLALLPLRAWAGMVMHLPPQWAASQSAAPCHGVEPAAEAAQADADDRVDGGAGAQACALCAVCHGAMLSAADTPPPQERGAGALPPALRPAIGAVDAETLFRPPRR